MVFSSPAVAGARPSKPSEASTCTWRISASPLAPPASGAAAAADSGSRQASTQDRDRYFMMLLRNGSDSWLARPGEAVEPYAQALGVDLDVAAEHLGHRALRVGHA